MKLFLYISGIVVNTLLIALYLLTDVVPTLWFVIFLLAFQTAFYVIGVLKETI